MSPYSSAEALFRHLTLDPSAIGVRKNVTSVTDAFSLSDDKSRGGGATEDDERPPMHANDNACLSAALVLGKLTRERGIVYACLQCVSWEHYQVASRMARGP